MNKQNNNLEEKELLKKVEDLIDNKNSNQKFNNSFLGFCSRLFSVKPKTNVDFSLSLKRELLKKHSAYIEKKVESRSKINKLETLKYKILNIKNLITMKKSIIIGMPVLVLAIVAIMVFQPFGSSIGKLVSGSSFIVHAQALYEQNLENSILHQTIKAKDGKDLKAYAKTKGISTKEAREEWTFGKNMEYWMDSKHDLSKIDGQYDLFVTVDDGKEEFYSNSECKTIMFDKAPDGMRFVDMSNMTDEEIEKELQKMDEEFVKYAEEYNENYDESDECVVKYWSSSDDEMGEMIITDTVEGGMIEFEADMEDIDSPESYLKFMEQLAKIGEVEAREYKEGEKTLIAFEEKMLIAYGEEFTKEMKGMENIFSRLVFDKATSGMVKEITIVELNGIKYEVSEMEIKTEWLDPAKNTDIFNPEKYELKKAEGYEAYQPKFFGIEAGSDFNFEDYKDEDITEIKTAYNSIKKDLSVDTQKEIEKLMSTLSGINDEYKFKKAIDQMYSLAESQLDKYYDSLYGDDE
jgi:hypothetical protein